MLVVERAVNIGDADNLVARVKEQLRRHRSHVAESLHDDARAHVHHPEFGQRAVAVEEHAAPGGLMPAARSAQVDRLAGNNGRGRVAHVHRVGVHDPGHGLLVGAEVGRGNVALRTEPFDQFGGIAPRDALQFAVREFGGIANHAALGAAERNIDHSAFPGHPAGQRAHFIERHVRSESNASLARPSHDGMMHAIADEHFQVAVIQHHRDVDRDFAVGITQDSIQALVEVELLGSRFEPRPLRFPGIAFFIHVRGRRYRRHRSGLRNDGRSGSADQCRRRRECSHGAGKRSEYMRAEGREAS